MVVGRVRAHCGEEEEEEYLFGAVALSEPCPYPSLYYATLQYSLEHVEPIVHAINDKNLHQSIHLWRTKCESPTLRCDLRFPQRPRRNEKFNRSKTFKYSPR